jgi:large conductance mechanosensitive channel
METLEYGKKSLGFFANAWAEFRDFAFKGNMIDLAVAVVIGGAFKTVIDSLVGDLIVPALSYLGGAGSAAQGLHIGRLNIGNFIGALINFLIIALAIFVLMVKIVGALMKRASKPTPPSEPVTKECPFCLSLIPIKAKKCAHCTADLQVTA